MKKQSGFTLVELAIVLMIIGLLIGGVLRGQELIENARVDGTIQQVKAYFGATTTFRDAYSGLPGDMLTATNRLPGCTADAKCGNGNGDNIIGFNTVGPSVTQSGIAVPQIETTYFWKHLALSGLISGVNPNADPASPVWGQTHPAAKIGGGFTIFYSKTPGDWGVGHVLRLQLAPNAVVGPQGEASVGGLAISPIQAAKIDRKMDDGLPDTGDVTADFGASGCDNNVGGTYSNTESKNCVMFFNMD